MQKRTVLVTGVANPKSIAWACALALKEAGMRVILAVQTERIEQRIAPAAADQGFHLLSPLDVSSQASVDAIAAKVADVCEGRLDGLVHSIAFAPGEDLKGRVVDISAAGFAQAMDISCYSLLRLSRAVLPQFRQGAAIVTMTYLGGERVVPGYGLMGLCKAALDASVRYLAHDLGPQGIGVYGVSPGPLRTRASIGVPHFEEMLVSATKRTALQRLAVREEVGALAAFLCSGKALASTGSIFHADGGAHVLG